MDEEIVIAILAILFVGVAIIGIYAWYLYNMLTRIKHNAGNALAQITVQLRRRHDLIPNLTKSVRGYMSHEHDTLEDVIEARNQSQGPVSNIRIDNPDSITAAQHAEGNLTSALNRLMLVMERYPVLKSDTHVSSLMEELRSTENRIAYARQSYNDVVTDFNFSQDSFPAVLFTRRWRFEHLPLLEVSDQTMKEIDSAPDVDLARK